MEFRCVVAPVTKMINCVKRMVTAEVELMARCLSSRCGDPCDENSMQQMEEGKRAPEIRVDINKASEGESDDFGVLEQLHAPVWDWGATQTGTDCGPHSAENKRFGDKERADIKSLVKPILTSPVLSAKYPECACLECQRLHRSRF